jgi:SpoVK/Ycf46/Vps4 family AAA+-type ATPase
MSGNSSPFERSTEFPDPDAHDRYQGLVGLDLVKDRIEKQARLLFHPELLDQWSKKAHGRLLPGVQLLKRRPPLYVFAGDVGTGKTALASTFGDAVARALKIPVVLHILSLKTRGSGAVGEMTKLISEAFQQLKAAAQKTARGGGKPSAATILLIDEADSLAQSREFAQMHHEDRAGVNALIRGVDDIAASALPCMVVMCTNRLRAIDPAVQRRAAAIFEFQRPNPEQLHHLLETYLAGADLSKKEIGVLAEALGPTKSRPYGYTFSDVTQRYIPTLILAAFPDAKITHELAFHIATVVLPTPPFSERQH